MKMNVTFAQTDMEIRPAFGVAVQSGGGSDEVIFIPCVSGDGMLSWTNNGGLPNPETINIKGKDGYTPVRGTDYWTEADKTEMITEVVAAFPVYNGEVV